MSLAPRGRGQGEGAESASVISRTVLTNFYPNQTYRPEFANTADASPTPGETPIGGIIASGSVSYQFSAAPGTGSSTGHGVRPCCLFYSILAVRFCQYQSAIGSLFRVLDRPGG